MKRHLISAVLVIAVTAIGWLAHVRSGQLRTVALIDGAVVAPPAGGPGSLAWIEDTPDGTRLMTLRGGRPRVVLSQPDLSGLAVTGATALVNQGRDGSGRLLTVDLTSGSHEVLAPTIGGVPQIAVGNDAVYWIENRQAAVPGVPFVVAAGAATVIRSVARTGGPPSLVAIISMGQPPAVSQKPGAPGPVDLLGVASGSVYWAERRSAGTEMETSIRRCAPGAPPETLAVEPGTQLAALAADRLLWTAASQEAAIPQQYVAVKQRALDREDTGVVADWLDERLILLASGAAAYVQHPDKLWRLGRARGSQRVISGGAGAIVAAGVAGDRLYLVRREAKGSAIVERPLTSRARARRLFGG